MRKLISTHGRRLHKNSAEWHKLIATLLLILTTLRRQITHHVRYGNGSTVTSEYITLWCCWLAICQVQLLEYYQVCDKHLEALC